MLTFFFCPFLHYLTAPFLIIKRDKICRCILFFLEVTKPPAKSNHIWIVKLTDPCNVLIAGVKQTWLKVKHLSCNQRFLAVKFKNGVTMHTHILKENDYECSFFVFGKDGLESNVSSTWPQMHKLVIFGQFTHVSPWLLFVLLNGRSPASFCR